MNKNIPTEGKFVASYSGGKDSVLAIYRAIKAGLEPAQLITTYNTALNRSWFHGLSKQLLQKVSVSLAIPVTLVKTSGNDYAYHFEKALISAKNNGANVCVFGDIDIEEHLEWCSMRCENTGLIPYFPLWKENRKKLVYESIDIGFSSIIKVVNTNYMSKDFLGQVLSRDVANSIEKSGADICGENGEYHTFTFDGPLFKEQIDFTVKEQVEQDNYAILGIE